MKKSAQPAFVTPEERPEQFQKGKLNELVYAIVREVPDGKVITYGDIAERLGNRGLARAVGNCLHRNPDPDYTPCFRVVNSDGRLAPNFGFGGPEEQQRRLEANGIQVVNGKVDLKKYRWKR